MSESFTLRFLYQGIQREVECTFRASSYTYQFLCVIDGQEMILEKDDEGKLRALAADPFSAKKNRPDPALVTAMMEELENILN